MTWWQRVRGRGRLEDELDAELRFHFDRLVADGIAAGLPEEEARRRARAEFGGLEAVKDACREARGTRWAHDLAQDVRFSVRLLAQGAARRRSWRWSPWRWGSASTTRCSPW